MPTETEPVDTECIGELIDKVSLYREIVISHIDSDNYTWYTRERKAHQRRVDRVLIQLRSLERSQSAKAFLKSADELLMRYTTRIRELLVSSQTGEEYPFEYFERFCDLTRIMQKVVEARNLVALALWIAPCADRWLEMQFPETDFSDLDSVEEGHACVDGERACVEKGATDA